MFGASHRMIPVNSCVIYWLYWLMGKTYSNKRSRDGVTTFVMLLFLWNLWPPPFYIDTVLYYILQKSTMYWSITVRLGPRMTDHAPWVFINLLLPGDLQWIWSLDNEECYLWHPQPADLPFLWTLWHHLLTITDPRGRICLHSAKYSDIKKMSWWIRK